MEGTSVANCGGAGGLMPCGCVHLAFQRFVTVCYLSVMREEQKSGELKKPCSDLTRP